MANSNANNVVKRSSVDRRLTWGEMDGNFEELIKSIGDIVVLESGLSDKVSQAVYDNKMQSIDMVNDQQTTRLDNIQDNLQNLQGEFGLNDQGTWIVSATYNVNDVVTYNDRSYVSLEDNNIGNAPPTSQWVAFDIAFQYILGRLTEDQLSLELQQKVNNTLPYNTDATRAPTATDDVSEGWVSGSLWIDNSVDPKEAYRCVDNTESEAVWINTTLTTSELANVALSGDYNDLMNRLLISSSSQAQNGTNDTTAMSPTKVHEAFGLFGLGRGGQMEGPPGDDWDNVVYTGFYQGGGTTANSPPTAGGDRVIHLARETQDQATQIALSNTENEFALRTKVGAVWSDWVTFLSGNDFSTKMEAEDGSDDDSVMSPLRVHNAFNQYGLGDNGPSIVDLDDAEEIDNLESGFYSAQGGTSNRPINEGGSVLVIKHSNNYSSIQFVSVSDATLEMYQRVSVNGVLSPWIKIYTANDRSSSSQATEGTNDETIMTPVKVFESFSQYGLGATQLSSIDDFNDVTRAQLNRVVGLDIVNNAPIDDFHGTLLTQTYNGTANQSQMAIHTAGSTGTTPRIFFRKSNGGNWSDWVEVITSSNLEDQIKPEWTATTTNLTLNGYNKVDFSSQRTLTLPNTPSDNDFVEFYTSVGDPTGSTIERNGETIMGLAEDMTIDQFVTSLKFVYNGSDWRIV